MNTRFRDGKALPDDSKGSQVKNNLKNLHRKWVRGYYLFD